MSLFFSPKMDIYDFLIVDEAGMITPNLLFPLICRSKRAMVVVANHLESHIFYELKRSSKEKTSEYIEQVLSGDDGVVRVIEIIGNSGNDSTNGPYVQIDDKVFSDVIDLANLREKSRNIDIQSQPIHIQAVLKVYLMAKNTI